MQKLAIKENYERYSFAKKNCSRLCNTIREMPQKLKDIYCKFISFCSSFCIKIDLLCLKISAEIFDLFKRWKQNRFLMVIRLYACMNPAKK